MYHSLKTSLLSCLDLISHQLLNYKQWNPEKKTIKIALFQRPGSHKNCHFLQII
jgi:hypothetical protein